MQLSSVLQVENLPNVENPKNLKTLRHYVFPLSVQL